LDSESFSCRWREPVERDGAERRLLSRHDPFGTPVQPVKDDARLRGHMITLQGQIVKAGGKKLVSDHLRHSAATEAEETGCDLDQVWRLTAHKDRTMLREGHVPQSAKITRKTQRKRASSRRRTRIKPRRAGIRV
jgi:hypothetical protein